MFAFGDNTDSCCKSLRPSAPIYATEIACLLPKASASVAFHW